MADLAALSPNLAGLGVFTAQAVSFLPAVNGIINADSGDTHGSQVEGDGLVALVARLGTAHDAVTHGLLARAVRLAALVDIVGRSHRGDTGQARVQEALVAPLLVVLVLLLGREGLLVGLQQLAVDRRRGRSG